MPQEPSAVEQAIARALRDNLATLQRSVTELEQAVADLVAACSSSRPANALPPMLRAQTASASLEASLSVMARFLAASMHSSSAAAAVAVPMPAEPLAAAPAPAPPAVEPAPPPAEVAAAPAADAQQAAAEMVAEGAPVIPPGAALAPPELRGEAAPAGPAAEAPSPEPVWSVPEQAEAPAEVPSAEEEIIPTAAAEFDISTLSPEEQLLHRRANRVAKVSMQDIQMLHPELVAQGREFRDICQRLRDDIDRARREYDRRFQPILHHPVDYFYHWMVEILGNGDPRLLGEYPYPSPVGKR
jgi:hypothetical protein